MSHNKILESLDHIKFFKWLNCDEKCFQKIKYKYISKISSRMLVLNVEKLILVFLYGCIYSVVTENLLIK